MKIYLVGISFVGKSTIGKLLADIINFKFYDLDLEIEDYYQKPIEKIQDECFSMNGYRAKGSVVLDILLSKEENSVIAGTPAGLRNDYLTVYKKYKKKIDLISIFVMDSPGNVLDRLMYYSAHGDHELEKLEENKRGFYLRDTIADYNFFKISLNRADLKIDIENIPLKMIPDLIIQELKKYINENIPNANQMFITNQ
jgi:shikimate kinase